MTTVPQSRSLTPVIEYRVELDRDGVTERRRKRKFPNAPPGVPTRKNASVAFMFTCPIVKHHIIACRLDVQLVGDRGYVCYHTFPRRAAAIMYVRLCGG